MQANPSTIRGVGWAVALATLLLMLATESKLAIVWDEGYTLGREARLRLWFRALVDPPKFASTWQPPNEELVQPGGVPAPTRMQVDSQGKLLFDPAVVAWFWPFAREEPHGHPPFYALVGLIGDVVTPWRPTLERARLGPMLIFSITAGSLFAFVRSRWGIWPASAAAGAWVFQPNLFAHGHYATYDAILTALWVSAVVAFAEAVEPEESTRNRWLRVVVFGLLLGAAADTKLTGWFLPLPFLAWTAITRSRRGLVTLVAGGLVAMLVLAVLNPPWWTDPIAGLTKFFDSNLGRARSIRIKTLFLGQVYSTPDGSLPWYNTLVWTLLVTPVGFLVLSIAGVGRAVARWKTEPFGLLVLGHWSFLLILRSLPHTPGHDGVRQILPAFGMLALMAGLGAASAVERWGRWGKRLVWLALMEGVASVAVMMPVPLSYFSPLVGGLPGATALGMEPTYYWDSLSDDTLDWLKSQTRPGQKVRFATHAGSWLYLRDAGRLPEGLLPEDPGVWAWYVVQNRPGSFWPRIDRELIAGGKPAFVVKKLGVPLLWVFPFEQVEAVMKRQGKANGPSTPREPGRLWAEHFRLVRMVSSHSLGLGGGVRHLRAGGDGLRGGRNVRRRGASHGGFLVAAEFGHAHLRHLEAALLGDGGASHRSRDVGDRGLALGLVTSLSFARGQNNAKDAGEGQGEDVAKHCGFLRTRFVVSQDAQAGTFR